MFILLETGKVAGCTDPSQPPTIDPGDPDLPRSQIEGGWFPSGSFETSTGIKKLIQKAFQPLSMAMFEASDPLVIRRENFDRLKTRKI